MTARQISPVANFIAAGLSPDMPPEARQFVVSWIRREYGLAKGSRSELARRLGVGRTTVHQWFADYGLGPDLDEWNAAGLRRAVAQSAAGARQARIVVGELPWTDPSAKSLFGRVRRNLDRSGYSDVEAEIRGEKLVLRQGKNELEI